jgi:thymidylate synthase
MRVLTTREAIDNLLRVLVNSGKDSKSQRWQALPSVTTISENPIIEVCDLFVKMHMADQDTILGSNILLDQTGADSPWAEDHFTERLAGPSNPGEQYKNWPYWKPDSKFMDGQVFSHTYQERFWPKGKGLRYDLGDWEDVKNRMARDIYTRQAFLAIWHPEDQSNNGVRVPCTIGYWFKVTDGVLNMTYLIRSCDARRHLRNDVYMAQRLAWEMAVHLRRCGNDIKVGQMNMWVGSLHCFQSDMYTIKKQIR